MRLLSNCSGRWRHVCSMGGSTSRSKMRAWEGPEQHGRAARQLPMARAPRQGIEIGSGFSGARMLGSEHNDEFFMSPDGEVRTRTNRCGAHLAKLAHARRHCRFRRCAWRRPSVP